MLAGIHTRRIRALEQWHALTEGDKTVTFQAENRDRVYAFIGKILTETPIGCTWTDAGARFVLLSSTVAGTLWAEGNRGAGAVKRKTGTGQSGTR